MNHHIYSAEDILATLIFAEQFIDVNTQGIFRETANKPQFMALLKKIQEVKDLALPFAQQVTVLDTWLQLTQQESPMPKQLAITDIHWANLIKIMLQNGSIINKDSLKVNAAWRIWLKTLQQNYQIYLNLAQYSTHDILTTQQAIKKNFKDFLGQLCQIKAYQALNIIHIYLHISHRVWQAQHLSAKNFSVVNALPLLEGLELEAKLLDISQPKLGNFYKFLSWIYTPILCDDFFNQSFEINHYINFAQPPELFNSLVDMLNNELWSGSDAQSASDPINSPDKKIKKINSLNAINFLGTRGDNFNLAPADPVAKQSPSNLMRRLSLNSFIPKAKTNKLGSPNRLSNKSKNPAFSYLLDLKQSSESSSSMHDLSISFDELLTEPDIGYFSKGTISESKAQRSYSENLSRKKSMVPGFVLDQKRRAISLNINERYTDLPMPEVADQQLSSSHHKKKGWLAKNFDASKKLHHAK